MLSMRLFLYDTDISFGPSVKIDALEDLTSI